MAASKRGETCRKCGTVHERCLAHNRAGKACGLRPSPHQEVCGRHGGSTPAARSLAAARDLEERTRAAARTAWGIGGEQPVDDPLAELAKLAGEIVAWAAYLRDRVTQLDGILTYWVDRDYYGPDGEILRSEAVENARAIVAVYERAQDRAAKVLATIVKLDIAERMMVLRQAQAAAIVEAVRAGLATVDLEAAVRAAALEAIAEQLGLITEPPPQIPKELTA